MKMHHALLIPYMAALGISLPAEAGRWHSGPGNTYGYSMMTPQEITDHQQKMRSFKSVEACKAYINEHHRLMAERAKKLNRPAPPMMNNPCEGMRHRGWIK